MEQEEPTSTELEISSLDGSEVIPPTFSHVTRWLRSWRGRLALTALCVTLVAGAMVTLFVHDTADPIGVLTTAFGFATATPVTPLPPGSDTFILDFAVPWGKLTVDGQRPALSEQANLGLGFTLKRGAHHLSYQARYFSPLTCMISVPQSRNDTCPLVNVEDNSAPLFQRFLDLQDIPQRMAPSQEQNLLSVVSTLLEPLTTSATIAPGERYLNEAGQIVTAQSPLTFTMGVSTVAPTDASFGACASLCADPSSYSIASTSWLLNANLTPTWTVTDPHGQRFNTPITSQLGVNTYATLDVNLTAAGWDVQVEAQQSLLAALAQTSAMQAMLSVQGNVETGTGWGVASGANPADGAIVVTSQNGSEAIQTVVLWRFGLLYATNSVTKAQFPSLPMASQSDRALAQSMLVGYSG